MPNLQSAFQIGWHAQDSFEKKTSQIPAPTIETKASRNYYTSEKTFVAFGHLYVRIPITWYVPYLPWH